MPIKTKTTKVKKTATVKAVKIKSPRKPSKASKSKSSASTPKHSSAERKFAETWLLLYPQIDLHSEHRFCPPRRFRFDFAHLDSKIAIEINGGNWGRGRHTNPLALNSEYEKLNLAVVHGWRVFVLSPEMITEKWLEAIASAIQAK